MIDIYVVIFRASLISLDAQYSQMADALRQRALAEFGCLEFTAVAEGDDEIALSYWHSLDDIARWRVDSEHRVAQALGREAWYSHYRVEIAEIQRHYTADTQPQHRAQERT